MPKPVALTPDALTTPSAPKTPAAATKPRRAGGEVRLKEPTKTVPLQVRIPADEARAIKLAATERDMSYSDFMLSCFHAFMQNQK